MQHNSYPHNLRLSKINQWFDDNIAASKHETLVETTDDKELKEYMNLEQESESEEEEEEGVQSFGGDESESDVSNNEDDDELSSSSE